MPGLASGFLEAMEVRAELELCVGRLNLNLPDFPDGLPPREGLPPSELLSAGGLCGGLGGAL
jgi:hypothetical protein